MELKLKVPGYGDGELRYNNFTLFYKPYALWTSECQRSYSTEEVAELGIRTNEIADYQDPIFIVTLLSFCQEWFFAILYIAFIKLERFNKHLIFFG